MNDINDAGPCAGYEHLIVELQEGTLGAEDVRAVRSHLSLCPRCRAWQSRFIALDAQLAEALPRPALSQEFAATLRLRIAAETRRSSQGDLRTAADDEYRRMVAGLRQGSQRNAFLGAVAAVIGTACALVALRFILPEASALLPSLSGQEREVAFGLLGASVALAALAWSGARGVLPAVRLSP
jgi:anti-sigma factor RsiW